MMVYVPIGEWAEKPPIRERPKVAISVIGMDRHVARDMDKGGERKDE
jgi:hypothetical protein